MVLEIPRLTYARDPPGRFQDASESEDAFGRSQFPKGGAEELSLRKNTQSA